MSESKQGYLRPKQAAELLGVSRKTVERYARHKKIPSVKIGRTVYIPSNFMDQVGVREGVVEHQSI